jgi:hypothetical protein
MRLRIKTFHDRYVEVEDLAKVVKRPHKYIVAYDVAYVYLFFLNC